MYLSIHVDMPNGTKDSLLYKLVLNMISYSSDIKICKKYNNFF